MKLTEFIVLANKTSSIAGVLINIESMATTLMSSHTYIAVVVSVWMSLSVAENIAHRKTLHGDEPLVIVHGGFYALFPNSSSKAYEWVGLFSLHNVVQWFDVQVTKDGVPICFPDFRLYESGKKSYYVNGVWTEGWFSTDYVFAE